MTKAEFEKKFGQFYAAFWILGLSLALYGFFQIKKLIFYHKDQILNLEYRGVVDSLRFTDKQVLIISVNHKSYNLEDYKTKFNNNSIIEKGDSVIKEEGIYNIKLVKHQSHIITEIEFKK